MTFLSIADRDRLHSLSWYMSARQTALRSALSFRTPLSVTDLADMRVHYSGYFLNLLAATELFREKTTSWSNDFEAKLYARFVFDGFQDGKANYSYIRELRNAVIHRGLDIVSAAHVDGCFPMIYAEPKIQNRLRTETFFAFGKYLLNVIEKCELVIGPVMLDCLNAAGIFEAEIDTAAAVAEFREAIEQAHSIPKHFKEMALVMEFKPEWAVDAHNAAMAKLREALVPCNTTKSLAS
ncbi:hypothetical protein [Zoogloea sp.]|uniref:hypothetical protein n=1 Tax=Zoogloea sp. TaxID=49181 RepID=UPI002602F4A7|nr:hypothetical protein [uncultured Zoogloea sp.]